VTAGTVSKLQAYVGLTFGGRERWCLIDTGFTGHLALPSEGLEEYELFFTHEESVELADGTGVLLPFYDAVVEWQGYEVEIQVVVTGDKVVLGTGLLAGWELRAQFIEGGLVTVGPIETTS
jgi:clan AA aspartic protease